MLNRGAYSLGNPDSERAKAAEQQHSLLCFLIGCSVTSGLTLPASPAMMDCALELCARINPKVAFVRSFATAVRKVTNTVSE